MKKEIKVTYTYIEPKTEEEREEAKKRLNKVYFMIFEKTLERLAAKKETRDLARRFGYCRDEW